MPKPSQLLKRTLASNSMLIRERQWFVDYLYSLHNSLRKIVVDGKNSGIVDLVEMDKIVREIGSIVGTYDRKTMINTGSMVPPKTPQELGETTTVNEMTQKYNADMDATLPEMESFIQKMIDDIIKQQPKGSNGGVEKTDNQDPKWGEWKFYTTPDKDMFQFPPNAGETQNEYGLFDFPPEKPKKDVDGDED